MAEAVACLGKIGGDRQCLAKEQAGGGRVVLDEGVGLGRERQRLAEPLGHFEPSPPQSRLRRVVEPPPGQHRRAGRHEPAPRPLGLVDPSRLVDLGQPLLDLLDPLARADVPRGVLLDLAEIGQRRFEVSRAVAVLGGLEVADERLDVLQGKPAHAAGLVHPPRPSADRATPLQRCPAVAANRALGRSRGQRVLGQARASPAPEVADQPLDAVRDGAAVARDAQGSAGVVDQAVGALGGDSGRGRLVAERLPRSGREVRGPLQRELDRLAQRLLGVEAKRPIVAGSMVHGTEVRLRVGHGFEPRGLLGRDLGLVHPAVPLGVGPGGDLRGRGVARQAQGVVEVALADVVQSHPNLASRGRVEHVGRGLELGNFGRALGQGGIRLRQPVELGGGGPQPLGLGLEQSPIGDREAPLGGA